MSTVQLSSQLGIYSAEATQELHNILDYWLKFSTDSIYGGFVGKVDNNNIRDFSAPKGSVLNARILWSFSAAYNLEPREEYLEMAEKAFWYIVDHLIDREDGGVYWTVTPYGEPLDTKKQVYAIAFTIYAFSEYHRTGHRPEVKSYAIELFHLLHGKAFDKEKSGYFEAFSKDWSDISDLRLSDKDANEKKTMNTHLHVLEAYTNLYRIWKDEVLKDQIEALIHNFLDYIISESGHLVLFFDENWTRKSDTISYGHDIEAAWLLLEAAEVIEDEALIQKVKEASIKMADAAGKGLAADGGLYYEYEPSHQQLVKEKHWWVQAEAMVGFFNAYQLSTKEYYLKKSLEVWEYTKRAILDKHNGEWFWGVTEEGEVMKNQDKIGLWKCPYHNSRACIEIIRRIG